MMGIAVRLSQASTVTQQMLDRWMQDVAQHMVGAVQRNIGPGGLIGRRTGTLARAIVFTIEKGTQSIQGDLYVDPAVAVYGGIQEEGGTIVPTHGQFLAIPLPPMLTGNLVARGTAADVRANPEAYGFIATFIPRGKHVIMAKVTPYDLPISIFALKTSVTLPGRHYMSTTLVQETTWIADRLEQIANEDVSVIFGET